MDAVAYALAVVALPDATYVVPGSWTIKTALPAPRDLHGQSTLSDGTVLVTGGRVSGLVSADVQSYDPSTNAWTTKTALPATRYFHAQSTLNDGTVLVTGGRDASGVATADVQQYDPSTNAWALRLRCLPHATHTARAPVLMGLFW